MFAKTTLVLITILQALTLAMTIISFTIYPVYAQTSVGSNMSSSMIESARMHIRAADKALASGNATGADYYLSVVNNTVTILLSRASSDLYVLQMESRVQYLLVSKQVSPQ